MHTPRRICSVRNSKSVFYRLRLQQGARHVSFQARCSEETAELIDCYDAALSNSKISLARNAIDIPPLPGQRKPRDKNIKIENLSATIEAHRSANFAKRIRRYFGKDSTENKDGRLKPLIKIAAKPREEAPKVQSIPTGVPKDLQPLVRKVHGYLQGKHQYLSSCIPPHLTHQLGCSSNSQERLSTEINVLHNYLRPTKAESDAVKNCVQETSHLIGQILPGIPITSHGPRAIGLADPLSEIDLGLQMPDCQDHYSKTKNSKAAGIYKRVAEKLRHLQKSIAKHGRYSEVAFSTRAHKEGPALRISDKPTGLTIWVIQKPSLLAEELAKYYLQEFPQLASLHNVVYQALHFRGLHKPANGGLDPYGLLVMMLTALGHSELHLQNNDLGQNLLHFLKFWAEADLLQHGYSADPPYSFPKYSRAFANDDPNSAENHGILSQHGMRRLVKDNLVHLKSGLRPYKMCLQDPAHPYRDLGNPISQIRSIQDCFSITFDCIKDGAERWNKLTRQERRSKGISTFLLRDLLVGDCQCYVAARERIRRASPNWM